MSQECVSAFSIMINQAETDLLDLTVCPAPFDSDAGIIGVDNRASATITNVEEDVVPGTLELINKKVKVLVVASMGWCTSAQSTGPSRTTPA